MAVQITKRMVVAFDLLFICPFMRLSVCLLSKLPVETKISQPITQPIIGPISPENFLKLKAFGPRGGALPLTY